MKEVKIDTYCGLSCAACSYKEKCNCGGCVATQGKPFHGSCEVAECAKRKKRWFCGECADFPCEILTRYAFDPEQGDNGARIENCKSMKAALVANGREGVNPISVCGHHCDYCFLGQWCGGCRSTYNCCSFATLYEDGICPNVKCADSKGLKGCFDCLALEACTIGFYGKPEEPVAKATALFIQRHGEACYTETLKKAIADGVRYAEDFNETMDVKKALMLLEKYL